MVEVSRLDMFMLGLFMRVFEDLEAEGGEDLFKNKSNILRNFYTSIDERKKLIEEVLAWDSELGDPTVFMDLFREFKSFVWLNFFIRTIALTLSFNIIFSVAYGHEIMKTDGYIALASIVIVGIVKFVTDITIRFHTLKFLEDCYLEYKGEK